VEQGLDVGKAEADACGEVVLVELGFGFFEGPGDVMDVGAEEAAEGVAGKEAVALGEEVLDGAGAALHEAAAGAEAAETGGEADGLAAEQAMAVEGELAVAAGLDFHLGPVVGELEDAAGDHDGEQIGGVEGEEVDARCAGFAVADVSAEIELGELAHAGDGREAAEADAVHPEGDNAEPGRAVEGIRFEALGEQGLDG